MINVKRQGAAGVVWKRGADGVRVLVIRHITGSRSFPGGGIKRKENAEEAVRRELREEIGLQETDIVNVKDTGISVSLRKRVLFAAIEFTYCLFTVEARERFEPRRSLEVWKWWWMRYNEVEANLPQSFAEAFKKVRI